MLLTLVQSGAPSSSPSTGPAPAATTTQTAPAAGAPAGAPAPAPGNSMWQFLPLVLMFVVFYFLLIRPQRKQQKDRDMMIANLKKNDHVVTHAGLIGIVKQINDQEFVLCVDESKDVRIRVLRTAIASVLKTSGGGEGEAKPETSEKAKS